MQRVGHWEGDNRGWAGWIASSSRWTWSWVDSGSWWWSGRPGMPWFMGLQRVRHNWETELNWTHYKSHNKIWKTNKILKRLYFGKWNCKKNWIHLKCRFLVAVVSGYILEKAMTPPFSKLIIKDSGSNVGHKFFMIWKKNALSLYISLEVKWTQEGFC